MLMLDFAREQAVTRDHVFTYARMAQEAGYGSLGLYLEHRFAYACVPWAQGKQCITADLVRDLQSEFPSLTLVPFLNVLGHMEGFIYTEGGRHLREETFTGLQACPSHPELRVLATQIVDEVMGVFSSDIVHIGGDETYQLHRCSRCLAAVPDGVDDPKAWLYNDFYRPLLEQVLRAGRTPGIWGDMFLDHPAALDGIPRDTVIFDWHYEGGVAESAAKFEGFRVYGCPTLHVFDAAWMHVEASERNVREVSKDVRDLGLEGVCVTLWEGGLFGAYDTMFPALGWCAAASGDSETLETIVDFYAAESREYGEWAHLMGVDLERIGGVFAYRMHRHMLKSRLLMYSNPFLAWMHHHEELCGSLGDAALAVLEKALRLAPSEACKNATLFVRGAVEFVRLAEAAHTCYARGDVEKAVAALAPARYLFETLEAAAKSNHLRIGGSMADIERCRAAKRHVETVIHRIRQYGGGELGYLPSFEVLTNPRFMPHDQGCWWLVNKWANE